MTPILASPKYIYMNKKKSTKTILLILIFTTTACSQKANDNNESNQQENLENPYTSQLVNAILNSDTTAIKGKETLLANLLDLSDKELRIKYNKNVIGAGTPYNTLSCSVAEQLFTDKYNSLPQPTLKISYDALNTIIDYSQIMNEPKNIGFAVYPVVNEGKRSFVVFKAETQEVETCNDTIIPIPNQSEVIQYALLNQSAQGYTTISEQDFYKLKVDYQTSTSYDGQPIDNFYHPGGIFYNGDQLKEFYEDNNADSRLDIEFANVSVSKQGADVSNPQAFMQLHSAILILHQGENGRILQNGPIIPGEFQNRAIDFGHMCPPDCK